MSPLDCQFYLLQDCQLTMLFGWISYIDYAVGGCRRPLPAPGARALASSRRSSSCGTARLHGTPRASYRFQVKKKQFFRNFITITLFGAVGTLISFTVISLGALGLVSRLNIGALELGDYLALGAIFSATDSVCTLQVLSQDETPFLYSLVFGEGVVNDATSVVLFNAIQNFDLGNISGAKFLNFIGNFLHLFGTSTILGVATGLLSAYIIKKLYFGRHSTDHEVSIMMLMAYL